MAELIAGMFNTSRYKRSQGKVARQVTLFSLAAIFAAGAWLMSERNSGGDATWQYLIPAVIAAVGFWVAYRIVNLPSFADFLISVEAEMNKVSWPSRGELYRASLVVIIVIFLLVSILFGYDLILDYLMKTFLGI
ncbi:preprotein translocase subunit SecE [Adhaeretor mobilis]|uniref:Protein translocase subunit SecE n=1 Tax=Adhaeretor mobilis TaxID=1930276 RepID=A0A517N3I3_9BACT|nr:preprotein translocase subunit SecE [Adhaeretor mobilis]QDT01548.1 preprotein translocase subunit SecE [Adhaeretor mobilis]